MPSPAEISRQIRVLQGDYSTPEERQQWIESRQRVAQTEAELRKQMPPASDANLLNDRVMPFPYIPPTQR